MIIMVGASFECQAQFPSKQEAKNMKQTEDIDLQWPNNMISLVQCVSPYFAVFLVQIYMQEIWEFWNYKGEGLPSGLPSLLILYLAPWTNTKERWDNCITTPHPLSPHSIFCCHVYPCKSRCSTLEYSLRQVNIWQRQSSPNTCPRYWV